MPSDPTFLALDGCPICGGSATPIGATLRTFVRAFERIVECAYSYCDRCDFAFCTNPLTESSLERYYSTNDQYPRDTLTLEEARHLSSQIDFVRRHWRVGREPHILEIGAGAGTFLSMIVDDSMGRGYFEELNTRAAQAMRQRGHVDARSGEPRRFDLVVMRHLLEHIVDPVRYLRTLSARLAPHALLFVEVPDYTSLGLRQSDAFQLEHVNYFSLQALIRAAAAAGYTLAATEWVRTLGYSMTPNRVLRALLRPGGDMPEGIQAIADWRGLMDATLADFAAIDRFVAATGGRIAFYGAGTKTLEYFANSVRPPQDVAIYDLDPTKAGTRIGGNEVRDANTIHAGAFDAIVVMVLGFQREVTQFLRDRGIKNEQMFFIGGGVG